MTATTQTLTDFLLARIAEDEAPTWNLVPYDCPPDCCAPAGYVGRECTICRTREFGGTPEAISEIAREHDEEIHQRSRVLAECAAKRAIVEDFEILHADYGVTHDPTTEARRLQARVAMARLAAIYADHPDHDPNWRP